MAEICFDCLNKMMGGKLNKKKFIYSSYIDVCECCCKQMQVVIVEKNKFYF